MARPVRRPLKALGGALQALAELLDLGCADVDMTTDLDPLIVTALPGIGIKKRAKALPARRRHQDPRCVSLRT